MSSTTERMASDDVPGTPHARDTVTTAEVVVIPAAWVGKYVRLEATAGSGSAVAIAIRFGDATALPVIADRSSLDGSGNLTADVSVPHIFLAAGESRRFRLDPAWTHFAHISAATTGCLRFALATGTGT